MQKQTFENYPSGSRFQFQCIIVNQNAPAGIKDNRKQVKQPHKKIPYKFIGKTLAYFTDNQEDQQPFQGTAFFIGKNLLLTCAHNVCDFENKMAKKVYFYPAQPNDSKRIRLQVKQFKKADKYQFTNTKQYGPNIYDIALLELKQQDNYKTPDDYLLIKHDFDFQSNKKAIILAAGFPGEINKHSDSCYLYSEDSISFDQDGHYLFYKHTTTGGQSGMPLFEKISENQYELIGIHKGIFQGFEVDADNKKKKRNQRAFGLVFNEVKSQIISMLAEDMKTQQSLGHNYQTSKKKLMILLKNQKLKDSLHVKNDKIIELNSFNVENISINLDKNNQNNSNNQSEALKKYKNDAEKGDSSAQFNLAFCYKNGKGVQMNYIKAVQWYTKAAQQGNASAQNNLGNLYNNGEGVQMNYIKAVQWYTKAAQQGNASAQNNLGTLYKNGKGVQMNYIKAVQWYTKAALQGNKQAKQNLGGLKQENIQNLIQEKQSSNFWQPTYNMFSSLIDTPKMTQKLLSKPPFKYIFDIIMQTSKKTNYAKNLFIGPQLNSDFYNDRQKKIKFLNKIIKLTEMMNDESIKVRPQKIVAGLEPKLTNLMLQAIYKCATSGKSSDYFVKIMLEGGIQN